MLRSLDSLFPLCEPAVSGKKCNGPRMQSFVALWQHLTHLWIFFSPVLLIVKICELSDWSFFFFSKSSFSLFLILEVSLTLVSLTLWALHLTTPHLFSLQGGPGRVVNGAFMVLKGHRSIVNQVRFNPHTYMICSSGVEKVIKVSIQTSRLIMMVEEMDLAKAEFQGRGSFFSAASGWFSVWEHCSDHIWVSILGCSDSRWALKRDIDLQWHQTH